MAVKPTDLPEWATDPGADKTAPPIAKQEGGWLPLEKPPHQWFNWFFNLVYQWIIYLNDLTIGTIEVGDFGEFEITVDTAPAQTLKYQTTGAPGSGDMTFETEYVKCLKSLIASNITPLLGTDLNIGDLTLNPKRLFVAEVNSLLINAEILAATEPIESPNTPAIRAAHWKIKNDIGTSTYIAINGAPNAIGIASISDNRATIAAGAAGLRTIDIALTNGPTGGTSANGFNTIIQVTPSGLGMPHLLFIRADYQGGTGVRVTISDDAGNAQETDFNLSVYHV